MRQHSCVSLCLSPCRGFLCPPNIFCLCKMCWVCRGGSCVDATGWSTRLRCNVLQHYQHLTLLAEASVGYNRKLENAALVALGRAEDIVDADVHFNGTFTVRSGSTLRVWWALVLVSSPFHVLYGALVYGTLIGIGKMMYGAVHCLF